MAVWSFTKTYTNFALQTLLQTNTEDVPKKFNSTPNQYKICFVLITRAKVMTVCSFTKNIHKFCATNTTTHYHSRRCKENSIQPQIDIIFAMFR